MSTFLWPSKMHISCQLEIDQKIRVDEKGIKKSTKKLNENEQTFFQESTIITKMHPNSPLKIKAWGAHLYEVAS